MVLMMTCGADYSGRINVKVIIIQFCFHLFILSALCASEKNTCPPSMAEIFYNININWSKRNYKQVKKYVNSLGDEYDDYVPVKLVVSSFYYYWGGQTEMAVSSLESLQHMLSKHIECASPIFMELLDAKINRYRSLLKIYKKLDQTKEYRAHFRDPLAKTRFKHSKYWMDELLYFNVPEVSINNTGAVTEFKNNKYQLGQKYLRLDEKQMLTFVNSAEIDTTAKKAVVNELIRRRVASTNDTELLKGLCEGASGYTYGQTVKMLRIERDRYTADLLRLLSSSSLCSNKEYYIWALVRMRATDKETLSILQKISVSSQDRSSVREYAKKALTYLNNIK